MNLNFLICLKFLNDKLSILNINHVQITFTERLFSVKKTYCPYEEEGLIIIFDFHFFQWLTIYVILVRLACDVIEIEEMLR